MSSVKSVCVRFALAVSATGAIGVNAVGAPLEFGTKPKNEASEDAAPVKKDRVAIPASSAAWLIRARDTNRDGVLSEADGEWNGMKGAPSDSDYNKDGRLTYYELLRRLRENTQASAGKMRLSTAAERFPEGLPSWFAQRDQNGDGQVAMHEYERRWNASAVRRFQGYDQNNDGVITVDEALEGR